MKYNFKIITWIVVLLISNELFGQYNNAREPTDTKTMEEVIERISQSIESDYNGIAPVINLLKGIELTYDFPDYCYPTISFLREIYTYHVYDEIKDSSIVIITDQNKDILSKGYWRETFGNMYIDPIKIIMRVINYVEKDDLVIANYGTSNDSRADLVVFKRKQNILKPLLIYPKSKGKGLYSYPKIELLPKDTVMIGYNSGDAEDVWNNHNYFVINDLEFKFVKNINSSGWRRRDSIGNFTAMGIYTSFYNEDGSLNKKLFDCYAKYEDGTYKYYEMKFDKITLYTIDQNNPYYLKNKYKDVSFNDQKVPVTGPIKGSVMPTIWNNKKYIVSISELKIKNNSKSKSTQPKGIIRRGRRK